MMSNVSVLKKLQPTVMGKTKIKKVKSQLQNPLQANNDTVSTILASLNVYWLHPHSLQ